MPFSTSVGFSPRRISTMPSTPPVSSFDAENAGLRRRADLHLCRCRARRPARPWLVDHDVLDVADDLDQTHAANRPSTAACCRACAPPALPLLALMAWAICAIDRLYFASASGIDLDLILLDQSAERSDIRHAGHLQKARLDHPVLDFAQLHGSCSAPRACSDRVRRSASRAARESESRRPADRVAQFFENHLAREVIVGPVVERQFDHRQAEDRARAARNHVRARC